MNPWTPVDIRLRGLNTKADPKLAVTGALTAVENARYEKGDGESGIRISKRWRATAVDTTNQPTRIYGLGHKVYSVRSSGGENIFELRGNGSYGSQTMGRLGAPMAWATAVRGAVNVGSNIEPSWVVDSAQVDATTIVYLLNESDGQRVVWFDTVAEKVIASYKSTAQTGERARICVLGSKVLVGLFKESTNSIYIYEWTTTSATLRTTLTNVGATWPNVGWDWHPSSDNNALAVVHVETTSTSTIKLNLINTSVWGVSPVTWTAAAPVTAVAVVCGPSASSRVFWADNTTGLSTRTYSGALALTLATTVVDATGGATETRRAIGVTIDSNNIAYVATNVAENLASTSVWFNRIHYCSVSVAGVASTIVRTRGAGLASKPYRVSEGGTDRVYVLGALGMNTDSGTPPIEDVQRAYVFLEVSQTFALRARMLHMTAGRSAASTSAAHSLYNRFGCLPNLHAVGDPSGQGATAIGCAGVSFDSDPSAAELVNFSTSAPTPRLLSMSLTPSGGYFGTEHDGCLLLTGGVLHSFDGVMVRENGFVDYPTIPYIQGGPGGGAMADGSFSVVAMFERIDARGRVVESAVSPPSTVTIAGGGGNGSIQLIVSMYRLGLSDGETERVVVFCSTSNSSVHRRCAVVVNSRSSDCSAPILITSNNGEIGSQAIVYTQGEDDHYQPSAPLALCADEDRLYCVQGDTRGRVEVSKPLGTGIGPAFYPEFFRPVASKDGPITALARLDGVLMAFKARSFFAASGDGPDAAGNNDTLGEFGQRSLKVGALTQRHVVSDGDAVYTYGHTGIVRVGRDQAIDYWGSGAAVEDFVILAPSGGAVVLNDLRDACFVPDRKELHFALEDGKELVYNTEYGLWSVNPTIYASALAAVGGLRYFVADATYAPGGGATITGGIYKETPGEFNTDTHVTVIGTHYLSITTGWIKLAGLFGFQRIKDLLIATSRISATWTIGASFAFDDDDTWNTEQTASVAPSIAGSGGGVLLAAETPVQKCKSMRARLRETAISGTGEQGYVIGLAALCRIERGGRPMPAANTF
jgi:hypothetical protein